MHNEISNAVRIRFALPAARLRPYITTYYYTDVCASDESFTVEDRFHPEWANLRFLSPGRTQCAIGNDPLVEPPRFGVTGPTSKALRFRIKPGQSWGIGLMPLGWASLFNVSANDYADRIVDGRVEPAFASFAALSQQLEESDGFAQGLALIEAHMERVELHPIANLDKVEAISKILVDGDVTTVAQLAEGCGMNVRSLERLSKRIFGFSPKLLLRRQRFLRSLSQFMLEPSLKWLNTLDYQYHDQAHFIRDFKRFMGMSPSAYAKLGKPVLVAAARARMEIAGEAVQGLHEPTRESRAEESPL